MGDILERRLDQMVAAKPVTRGWIPDSQAVVATGKRCKPTSCTPNMAVEGQQWRLGSLHPLAYLRVS
jgi:hypothetical protein